jgi:ABC-type glycerol-3-phosphate transport system substrate-binding protein
LVWVSPPFDPAADTSAAKLLRARLAAFEAENTGFKVSVRVKAATGPGGMIDSLSAATAAAPGALPALVALPRTDLETAALKGLIFSLDGLTRVVDNADWYPYARQLALIQGSAFGLPFAGDGMLLLYRPTRLTTPPADWAGIIKASLPLAFPAADSQSLTTLLLYLSAGGQIKDNQGRPILQAEPLGRVLKQYSAGQQTGVFPTWLAQYQTDGQAWQAYREQRTHLVITWSSRYLADLPADTVAVPIPTLGNQPFTLATGWLWAVSEPQPDRRAAAARLAEYLVTSDFLSQWASAAGYMPTRPSALSSWSNQGLRALLSPVALAAQVRPSDDVLLGLGPVLQEATLQVIKQQGDPVQTAQVAVERLAVSPTK